MRQRRREGRRVRGLWGQLDAAQHSTRRVSISFQTGIGVVVRIRGRKATTSGSQTVESETSASLATSYVRIEERELGPAGSTDI
jgi:hypothetical protein